MPCDPDEELIVDEISATIRGLAHKYGSCNAGDRGQLTVVGTKLLELNQDLITIWTEVQEAQDVISSRAKRRMARSPSRIMCEEGSRYVRSSSTVVEDNGWPNDVIDPNSDAKIAWDCFVSSCVVYLTMSMPFALGFNAEASWYRARGRYIVDWLVDGVFLIDMLLCFRVAYTSNDGTVVKDKKRLFLHYLFSIGFPIDFVSVTSRFSSYLGGGSSSFLMNARLLRVVRLTKLFKLTHVLKLKRRHHGRESGTRGITKASSSQKPTGERVRAEAARRSTQEVIQFSMQDIKLQYLKNVRNGSGELPLTSEDKRRGFAAWMSAKYFAGHPALASAVWMLAILFVIAHLVACVWHGLVVLNEQDSNKERHWVKTNQLTEVSTSRVYLISLYWAFTTMTTVGYGDITVVTNNEKAFAIVVMIIGGICFGYIVGNVTSMLENLDMVGALHEQKLDAVKEYLYDRQYPGVMAVKIKEHFRYMYGRLGVFSDANEIYDELPFSLQIELSYELNWELIQQTPILSHPYATGPFVANMCRKLIPCAANAGEFLFFEGEIATHIFILRTGVVKLLATCDNVGTDNSTGSSPTKSGPDGFTCGTSGAGDVVGTEAALLTFVHAFSAFTQTKAQLYTVSKDDFIFELGCHAPMVRDWLTENCVKLIEAVVEGRLNHSQTLSSSAPGDSSSHLVKTTTIDQEKRQNDARKSESCPEITDASSDVLQSRVVSEGTSSIEGTRREALNEIYDNPNLHKKDSTCKLVSFRRLARYVRHFKFFKCLRQGRTIRIRPIEQNDCRLQQDGCTQSKSPPTITPSELYIKYGLFHPESQHKLAWDVFVSILIVYSIVSATYIFAFGLPAQRLCGLKALDNGWLAFFVFIDICFLIDMIATCNTAIVIDDVDNQFRHDAISAAPDDAFRAYFETSRRLIFINYLQSWWLGIDLLSSVPLDKFLGCFKFSNGGTMVFALLKLLRALRLIRLVKIRQKFKLADLCESLEDYAGINPALFKLIKPLAVMSMVAHAFTCLFFYVGRRNDKSWLDTTSLRENRTMRHEDRPTQYIQAIYWAFATMTTVGYGDVYPVFTNPSGLAVGIISQVLGTMIFAYVIGILVALVTNLEPSSRLFRAEKTYLAHYLSQLNNIKDALVHQLSSAQSHALAVRGVFNEAWILDQLPPYIRSNCLLYVFRDSLPYMPFFGHIETRHMGSVAILLPLLRPVNYLYGQVINSPSISAREVQFIIKGVVVVSRSSRMSRNGNESSCNGESHSNTASTKDLNNPETYGSQSYFGEATVLIPHDKAFKLRCRVICDAPYCHTFVMSKHDIESMRENYEPLLLSIEAEFYDEDLISRWIKFIADD